MSLPSAFRFERRSFLLLRVAKRLSRLPFWTRRARPPTPLGTYRDCPLTLDRLTPCQLARDIHHATADVLIQLVAVISINSSQQLFIL